MKLSLAEKNALLKKIEKIFSELDHTNFGEQVTKVHVYEDKPRGCLANEWFQQYSNFNGELNKLSHLLQIINYAKKMLENNRKDINYAENSDEIQYALKEINNLENEYREIHQSNQESEIMGEFKAIHQNQKKLMEKIELVIVEQKSIKEDLKTKARKSDIPSMTWSTDLVNKINDLAKKVNGVNEKVEKVQTTVANNKTEKSMRLQLFKK